MVLEVPVDEILARSSASFAADSGKVTSLATLPLLSDDFPDLPVGDILLMTVPTACKAVKDCFLEEPELVVGVCATAVDSEEKLVADNGPGVERSFSSAEDSTGGAVISITGNLFMSFLVLRNLKVFLLCAFCLCSLGGFSGPEGVVDTTLASLSEESVGG